MNGEDSFAKREERIGVFGDIRDGEEEEEEEEDDDNNLRRKLLSPKIGSSNRVVKGKWNKEKLSIYHSTNKNKILGLTINELIRKRHLIIFCLFLIIFFYTTSLYKSYTLTGGGCENRSCLPSSASNLWDEHKYLVYTQGCKIIDMDPFEESKSFIKKKSPQSCHSPLVTITNKTLRVDRGLLSRWINRNLKCCIREITRKEQDASKFDKNADWGYVEGKQCKEISETNPEIKIPNMKIECKNNDKGAYTDFHSFPLSPDLMPKNKTRMKGEFWKSKKQEEKPYSILIIGIDSISRLHMMRSMPKTKLFLEKNDFIELRGYTKIGENTFPNVMAIIAGLEQKEYKTCWHTQYAKLDNCPFIWKDFSKLNYITAFLEDAPSIAIFNYHKTGFVKQPTDYYLRTIMTAKSKSKEATNGGCMDGKSYTDYMIDYMKNFINNVGINNPYFLLSWFTSIAHDDFNGLQTADNSFQNLLQESLKEEHSNRTIIFFISDHGYRFGTYRETFIGFYEESLPFFYVRIPPNLKEDFPEWYQNLKINENRLTTPFDFHETLKDILSLSQSQNKNNFTKETQNSHSQLMLSQPNNISEKFSYSFFENGPTNRTCEKSKIPPTYCMCGVTPALGRSSELSVHLGKIAIRQINLLLKPVIESKKCVLLKFSKSLYGREIHQGEVWNNKDQLISYKDYLVAFEAKPSLAHFEAKIRIFANSTQTILDNISRINSYKGESDCINDYLLKNYCYCLVLYEKKKKL